MTRPTNSRHLLPAAMLAGQGKQAALLATALMVSACGGGGGGGTITPSGTPVVTFTSWNAAQPGSVVEAKGLDMQASYKWTGSNISNIDTVQEATASTVFMFDANTEVSRLLLTSGPVTMDFPGAEISSLTADSDFLIAKNSANAAIVSSPTPQGWNYQSFGVWETGRNSANGNLGVFSVGAPTPADAISGVDGASFTGKVVGSYVNIGGEGHTVLADLSVDVTWTGAGRSLAFSTTNTQISANGTSFYTNPDPDLDLNLTGTLIYDPAANRFSGSLTTTPTTSTTSRTLTGDSSGQFYGPNAEELGGVFFLKAGAGVESYRGAYGAQQVAP